MANIIIRANDPRVAAAISEGANAVELRAVRAECERLNALNGVRSYGDSVRYETACEALAVRYAVKRMNPVFKAILTAWACFWYGVYSLGESLSARRD